MQAVGNPGVSHTVTGNTLGLSYLLGCRLRCSLRSRCLLPRFRLRRCRFRLRCRSARWLPENSQSRLRHSIFNLTFFATVVFFFAGADVAAAVFFVTAAFFAVGVAFLAGALAAAVVVAFLTGAACITVSTDSDPMSRYHTLVAFFGSLASLFSLVAVVAFGAAFLGAAAVAFGADRAAGFFVVVAAVLFPRGFFAGALAAEALVVAAGALVVGLFCNVT